MYFYKEQSEMFPITNGTRQGSMLSPVLWSLYLALLKKEPRHLGVGCHVGDLYIGVVVYADDVLLMAPTKGVMQRMLDKDKCQAYVQH